MVRVVSCKNVLQENIPKYNVDIFMHICQSQIISTDMSMN